MNTSFLALKILKEIKKLTVGRRTRKEISSEYFIKKYGSECRYALHELYDNEYITCDNDNCVRSGNGIICIELPELDSFQITDKGLYYIAENNFIQTLSTKERLFVYLLGLSSGVLSGCAVQLFVFYVINR